MEHLLSEIITETYCVETPTWFQVKGDIIQTFWFINHSKGLMVWIHQKVSQVQYQDCRFRFDLTTQQIH